MPGDRVSPLNPFNPWLIPVANGHELLRTLSLNIAAVDCAVRSDGHAMHPIQIAGFLFAVFAFRDDSQAFDAAFGIEEQHAAAAPSQQPR